MTPPNTTNHLTAMSAELRNLTDSTIQKHRKNNFTISMVEPNHGTVALPTGTRVEINLRQHHFRFGTCIPSSFGNPEKMPSDVQAQFQAFILAHFNTVVCENAMKGYANDPDGPSRDYADGDRLLAFAEQHNLEMRGHCLFWDREKFVQKWVAALPAPALLDEITQRLHSIIPHYGNRVSCWDAINEMLDGGFFSERLGPEIYANIFKWADALAPDTPLFVNEFAILGNPEKTRRYCDLIESLRSAGAPVGGIGIQEHACERILDVNGAKTAADETIERVELLPITFQQATASLDQMSRFNLPIHLTEISAKSLDEQRRAEGLEALYRIGFSHPAVDLILLWGFWQNSHWLGRAAALIDENWNLLPAGQMLSSLLRNEWHTQATAPLTTDGTFSFSGFYGSYDVALHLPNGRRLTAHLSLPKGSSAAVLPITI